MNYSMFRLSDWILIFIIFIISIVYSFYHVSHLSQISKENFEFSSKSSKIELDEPLMILRNNIRDIFTNTYFQKINNESTIFIPHFHDSIPQGKNTYLFVSLDESYFSVLDKLKNAIDLFFTVSHK